MAYNQACILIQNCVGIGTDTPLGSLTVKQTPGDGGSTGGISIINDNNELKGSLFAGGSAPRAYGHLLLRDASNNDSVMFRTTGGSNFILCGNVGIGTNAPIGILEVRGASCLISSHGLLQVNSSTSVGIDLGGSLSFGGAYQSTSVTEFAHISGRKETATSGEYGGYLDFATRPHLGLNTSRMRITSTGNVGIGTAAPTSKLDICGADGKIQSRVDSSDGSTINVRPNAGKCGWISYTEDAVADRWGIGVKNGDAKLYFASGNVGVAGGTTRMIIDGGGCVGINTTSPSYRLHVNGTFYAAGSSQDYKQSICNYNTDSCMFMKLKPVTYQYKEEYCHLGKELKSGTQIGLIAEEVAESHPELAILVNEEDEKVVRNVDYEKLTIILLSEVQKLRQEVDQLKNK